MDSHSAFISATSAEAAIEGVMLTDHGSDTNHIPKPIFDLFKDLNPGVQVVALEPTVRC